MPAGYGQIRQRVGLARRGYLIIRTPIWPDTVHSISSPQAPIDPSPLRIVRRRRNTIRGTLFNFRAVVGGRKAGDQIGVGSFWADVPVNPCVPCQLAGI